MAQNRAHIQIPPVAQVALEALEQAGHEGWLVGGCVRDALMGLTPADIDIATDAPWHQAEAAFLAAGFTVHETGVKHGTITVMVHGEPVEVTTYRIDGAYSDGRHPDSVSFARSIDEDLSRRDFTVNAMAYHPARGLADPYGGLIDIERKQIRAVGDPATRFREDGLRILRAARFQSQLGFSIDPQTAAAMAKLAPRLAGVSVERQVREWDKLLIGGNVVAALLENIGVLGQTIPEIAAMRGFDQHTPYHCYDVLEHTAHVVAGVSPTPLLRWAALLHDVGKPAMYTRDSRGRGHFKGHAGKGAQISEQILARLKMPTAFARKVVLLVGRHDDRIEPTPKAVKRLLAKLDFDIGLFYDLCELKRADALAHAPQWRMQRVDLSYQLEACMERIVAEGQAFKLADLAIDGNDVIDAGVAAGPVVGRALQRCLDAVVDERVPNDRNALLAYLQTLELQSPDNG